MAKTRSRFSVAVGKWLSLLLEASSHAVSLRNLIVYLSYLELLVYYHTGWYVPSYHVWFLKIWSKGLFSWSLEENFTISLLYQGRCTCGMKMICWLDVFLSHSFVDVTWFGIFKSPSDKISLFSIGSIFLFCLSLEICKLIFICGKLILVHCLHVG